MNEQADKHAKIRLLNSRDISAIFAKLAYQKGITDGFSIRWNGLDRPTEARAIHSIEFMAGSRTARRELSDTALINLQTSVCLAAVWNMIREVVTELQA